VQVVLAVISIKLGVFLSECASSAFEEIKNRKGEMVNGQFVKEVTE